jgi:hypothetical protein
MLPAALLGRGSELWGNDIAAGPDNAAYVIDAVTKTLVPRHATEQDVTRQA